MGKGPTHLLFEGQKETWCENKCGEPQGDDRFEVLLTEGFLTNLKEGITGDSSNEQASTHRQGALGEGNAWRGSRLGHKGLVIASQDL
jgi:hypothetical protein